MLCVFLLYFIFSEKVHWNFVSTASMKHVDTMLSCSRPRLFGTELEIYIC